MGWDRDGGCCLVAFGVVFRVVPCGYGPENWDEVVSAVKCVFICTAVGLPCMRILVAGLGEGLVWCGGR